MANIFPSFRNDVWHAPRGSAYCPEYQTVYDSFSHPPPSDIAAAQNTMVKSLVDDGIWAKLDLFYVFANYWPADALINWINPGTYDAEIILNGGTMNFTAYEGFQSSTGSYIRCPWNAAVNGVNYTQNDASLGFYSRTNINEAKRDAAIDSGNTIFISAMVSNTLSVRINDVTNSGNAVSDSLGFSIANRSGASAKEYFHNKTKFTATVGSAWNIVGYLYFLCQYDGGPSLNGTKQLSLGFAGGSFTSVNDFEDTFEAYMDSNGKGVIT